MAEAYETQAFEEVYKHPTWKLEAETFENDFTRALYDDEAVKKEGQKALVHVSNILITYNQLESLKKGAEYLKSTDYTKAQKAVETYQGILENLKKVEAEKGLDEEQKQLRAEAEYGLKKGLKALEKARNDAAMDFLNQAPKELNTRDDEGKILSSLMLGGTGIGGQGYTITENSVQDTRKGAQYIREQMTEKGTLLNQMALLDNAMNTGGINLEGENVDTFGNSPHKKTLNDFLRSPTRRIYQNKKEIDFTAQYIKENGGEELNLEEISKFRDQSEEEQDAVIGSEGAGINNVGIRDAALTRTLNEEAKARKGVKQTGIKGMWNSVKSFFGGGQKRVGALSPELEEKKEEPKKSGGRGAWNSVKTFFFGNQPEEINYEDLTNDQWARLEAQGLTPQVLKKKWRVGMTEPQKRMLRMLRYEQQKAKEDKAAGMTRSMLKASGNINREDTSAKMDKLMNDRDREIARELNDQKFLTTKDAEEVIKDPTAQTGRLMNSSKTARNMLGMYKMLTKSEASLFTFRLALLAYLVPTRRNTIYEVMSQSHAAGVKGKEDLTDPALMYETISPYTKEEIREKLPGKKQFPHEKVFMTMVDEYSNLRDDARGISKQEHKDLIPNQKDMSIAEVARELLNPASGLALFARLRLLTDASITDDDIKKHIDRLSAEEQALVNEFMEKLAREQTIKFEDLKKWVEDNGNEIGELDKDLNEKLPAKEKELKDVMTSISNLENGSYVEDRKVRRDLDAKAKELESEIRALQEKKEKRDQLSSERPEKVKDYNERVDWKNNRESQAITAVNKIRKDLFQLLTATPTAYETDLEAQVPALRNRLLVITRLANRFLLDKFEEMPDFEDKYKFKEYQPDREEIYQSQIKEEQAGTLGQSEATKEENRRKAEEEKARIAAEKEMRKGLADRCTAMRNSVKDDEKLLPEGLENKENVDAARVGMAITRVVNTYLNFDPATVVQISDAGFPDVIPRLMRYQMAASQIRELLGKRPDANAAVSEENLQRIRRALSLQNPTRAFLEKRCIHLSTKTYGSLSSGEFDQKMQQIREKEGEGASEEEKEAYKAFQESKEAGDVLGKASEDQEEEIVPGTESGTTYLESLRTLYVELKTSIKREDPGEREFENLSIHLETVINDLSGTFNARTDIGTEAAEIAGNFGVLELSAQRCLEDADEKLSEIIQKIYDKASDMYLKFGQAAYRTVEILSKNNLFQKGDHLWARVMVIGAPLISGGMDSVRPTLEKAGTKKLSKEEIDAEMNELEQDGVSKTTRKMDEDKEAKSLSRFRALLGSADEEEMKRTLESYKRWDREDKDALKNKRKHEKELIDSLDVPEQKKEPEVKPPKPEQEQKEQEKEELKEVKSLTEQEIGRILAEQEKANIEAKEGEEDVLLESLQDFRRSLDRQKTGVLGLFQDKEKNTKIRELREKIETFISLCTKTVLPMEMEDGQVINQDKLSKEYQEQINLLKRKANEIKKYAFADTGSVRADEEADPWKALCRSIYNRFKIFHDSIGNMQMAKPADVMRSNAGADQAHREELRNDISSYAVKQNQDKKLRYVFFLMRGIMYKGETGYAAPKEWHTRKSLQKEMKKNPPKQPVNENDLSIIENVPPVKEEDEPDPVRFSINDTDSENSDILMEDLLNKSFREENQDENIDEDLNHLEEELKDGEYEDENGEQELTDEQKDAAKKVARRLAREEAEALRKQRENARAQVVLPKYEAVRAKRRRYRDDFDLTGEIEPEEALQEPVEQKAVRNRNLRPAASLPTGDKVAKVAGWGLFAIPHYVGKPVKWIGNGIVSGVNFALRWTKKKSSGPDSMQKTSRIATKERQDRIKREISNVKQRPSDQEVMADTSRVPMNWALETAENPELQPTVTVGATGVTDENKTNFVNSYHAWMRINYSKRDPHHGRNIRYRIDVGYGPRGGFGVNGFKGGLLNAADQAATGTLMPGALWDERGSGFANAKTYPVTNRQVNQMLLEAERYPAGGFNLVTRNCTSFLADVTQNAGVNTGDILQKAPIKLGAKYLTVPLLSLFSPVTKMISGAHGLKKSGQDDLSFQRYGEKQITEDEMTLMQEDNGVHTEGYTPLNTLQNIQNSGSNEVNALHSEFSKEVIQDDPGIYIRTAGRKLKEKIRDVIDQEHANAFETGILKASKAYENGVKRFPTATPGLISRLQKNFSENISKTTEFFYSPNGCGGNPELRVLFLEYIGVLNRAKMTYDDAFREALRRENNREFEESDISEQLKALTSGKTQTYSLKTGEGQEEMTSSPSLMIGYAKRGTSVGQTAEVQKKNQNKQNLLNALDTSVDADTAKLWQKESFSDRDVDLAFSTMQNQQESIEHNKMDYQDHYDFTGAEVMQAMIFERIYGGLKGRIEAGSWFKKPAEEQENVDADTYNMRSKQFTDWLKQDMEISANSHPREVEQIEKSIGKRLGLNLAELNREGKAAIQKEYRARLFTNYLVPLLVQAIFKKYGGDQYFSIYGLLKEQFAGE